MSDCDLSAARREHLPEVKFSCNGRLRHYRYSPINLFLVLLYLRVNYKNISCILLEVVILSVTFYKRFKTIVEVEICSNIGQKTTW